MRKNGIVEGFGPQASDLVHIDGVYQQEVFFWGMNAVFDFCSMSIMYSSMAVHFLPWNTYLGSLARW